MTVVRQDKMIPGAIDEGPGIRMKLDELLERLGWAGRPELRDVLETEWASSQESLPGDGLPFLSPQSVADACHVLSLPTSAQEALLAVARTVAADPRLSVLMEMR